MTHRSSRRSSSAGRRRKRPLPSTLWRPQSQLSHGCQREPRIHSQVAIMRHHPSPHGPLPSGYEITVDTVDSSAYAGGAGTTTVASGMEAEMTDLTDGMSDQLREKVQAAIADLTMLGRMTDGSDAEVRLSEAPPSSGRSSKPIICHITPPVTYVHQSFFGTPISFHWLLLRPVAATGHYRSLSLTHRDSQEARICTLRWHCCCRGKQQCVVRASCRDALRAVTQIYSEPAGALPSASGRAQGRAGGSRATPSQREMQLESKVRQMEEKMAMSRSIMRKLYHANVRRDS